jgi:hypothetical protein
VTGRLKGRRYLFLKNERRTERPAFVDSVPTGCLAYWTFRMGFGVALRLMEPVVLRTGCTARRTGFGKNPRLKLITPPSLRQSTSFAFAKTAGATCAISQLATPLKFIRGAFDLGLDRMDDWRLRPRRGFSLHQELGGSARAAIPSRLTLRTWSAVRTIRELAPTDCPSRSSA